MKLAPNRKHSEELAITLLKAGMALVFVALLGMFATSVVSEAATAQDVEVANGYVIRLASRSRQFSAADVEELGIPFEHRAYTTTFRKDGTEWQQLRLGFFGSKAEALAALRKIEASFPGAQVTAVSSADRRSVSTRLLASKVVTPSVPVQVVKAAAAPASHEAPGPADSARTKISSFFGKVGSLFGDKEKKAQPDMSAAQVTDANSRPAAQADKKKVTANAADSAGGKPVDRGAALAKAGNAALPAVPKRDEMPARASAAKMVSTPAASDAGKNGGSAKAAASRPDGVIAAEAGVCCCAGCPAQGAFLLQRSQEAVPCKLVFEKYVKYFSCCSRQRGAAG